MIPIMNKRFEEMTAEIDNSLSVYQVQPVDIFEIIKKTSFIQIMGKRD